MKIQIVVFRLLRSLGNKKRIVALNDLNVIFFNVIILLQTVKTVNFLVFVARLGAWFRMFAPL